MPRYTIDLLKAHVRSLGYVQYTGIQHDPNKMLHIKGITRPWFGLWDRASCQSP